MYSRFDRPQPKSHLADELRKSRGTQRPADRARSLSRAGYPTTTQDVKDSENGQTYPLHPKGFIESIATAEKRRGIKPPDGLEPGDMVMQGLTHAIVSHRAGEDIADATIPVVAEEIRKAKEARRNNTEEK